MYNIKWGKSEKIIITNKWSAKKVRVRGDRELCVVTIRVKGLIKMLGTRLI